MAATDRRSSRGLVSLIVLSLLLVVAFPPVFGEKTHLTGTDDLHLNSGGEFSKWGTCDDDGNLVAARYGLLVHVEMSNKELRGNARHCRIWFRKANVATDAIKLELFLAFADEAMAKLVVFDGPSENAYTTYLPVNLNWKEPVLIEFTLQTMPKDNTKAICETFANGKSVKKFEIDNVRPVPCPNGAMRTHIAQPSGMHIDTFYAEDAVSKGKRLQTFNFDGHLRNTEVGDLSELKVDVGNPLYTAPGKQEL